MTIDLAFASVSSRAGARPPACLSGAGAHGAAAARPHVEEARRPAASREGGTRLDDRLFGAAVAVLLLAVAVPWPAALSVAA